MEVMTEQQPVWITLADAEKQTNIPLRTLRELVNKNEIQTTKDIRDRRVLLVDLNELNEKYPAKRTSLDTSEN